MSIENTKQTTNEDPMDFLVKTMQATREGRDPSAAIEDMEAEGQRQFVTSTKLPVDRPDDQSVYEALGFVFGEVDPNDELFQEAQLPEGWSREPTEHSMWTHIVDQRGITRAKVFYKAAFYDRGAHMDLVRSVGANLLSDALYDDNITIPWEVLDHAEREEAIAELVRIDSEERGVDSAHERRRRERIDQLIADAEKRASRSLSEAVQKWREVLKEA